ncbi:g4155 [Coccomyxa viridis]|uniref:G4155 protein n=1 Tax=Coccomyxa viridis TaxID=1274662 RepID=A0ABP1FPL7_9CHLO
MQARRARRHLQDFAALPTTCPNCPDHPEMPLAASFFSWKLQKLSTALRARGVEEVPKKQRSAAQMLQKLCFAASHACPTCSAGISKQDNEVISTAATGSLIRTDLHAAGPAGVAHQSVMDLTLSLAQHIYRLHHLLTRQHASGKLVRDAAASRCPSSTKKTLSAKGPSGGATKGVGYGGGRSDPGQAGMTKKAASEAQKRQDEADAAMTHLLSEITVCLSTNSGQALPHALCVMSQQLMLAAALRRLLQNDSLLDIGSRRSLYLELVQLLKHLGTRSELLPVLLRPADFDEAQAVAEGPGDSATKAIEEGSAPCCMDALGNLDKQCAVFQRSAEAMAESADDEDMDALAIALEIASAYEQLQESCATLKRASGTSENPGSSIPGQIEPQSRFLGLSTSSGEGKARNAAEAQRSIESRYVEVMTPLRFRDHALIQGNDFYFRKAVGSSKPSGKAWLRRVVQEQSSLATSLPVAWSSSIFLAVDTGNLSALRALILGPDHTPYATGAFIFDIFLPPEYPNKPPTVYFLTTGGGAWRASPNLYNCGKVCLSLLGTWSGPGWTPGSSTILQVLVSIQSMIFVNDTYFNEPGYDRNRNTSAGQSASAAYNLTTARGTLQHAVLGALRNPAPAFADVIREHFRMKKQAVTDACHQWLGKYDATTKAIQAELDKLT